MELLARNGQQNIKSEHCPVFSTFYDDQMVAMPFGHYFAESFQIELVQVGCRFGAALFAG